MSNVYADLERLRFPFASSTMEGALKEWIKDEDEEEIKDLLEVETLDLSDPDTQDSLIEYMRDTSQYIYEVPLI